MRSAALLAFLIFTTPVLAQSLQLFSQDGTYLGNLNDNRYDPNSVSNPYGRYGNRFSPDSINNPYGPYGSRYSTDSVNSRYGTGIQIRTEDGRYLGNFNANRYDSDSVANPYGTCRSRYSAILIDSPSNRYGYQYSSGGISGSRYEAPPPPHPYSYMWGIEGEFESTHDD
jgi:hypothetical protein